MSKIITRALVGVLAAGVLVPLAGGAAQAASHSTKVTWTHARVVRWVDGDTVVTSRGTVRLIGVDTPERGRNGASAATKWAKHLAPVGSTVSLGDPASVKNTDRYGRHLRYVVRNRVDIDRSQINHGAKARYDSLDGYQWHPRQRAYRAADKRHPNYRGGWSSSPSSSAPAAPAWNYPYGGGGDAHPCPKGYPVKGNDNSGIYHVPGNASYNATNNRNCFRREIDAIAAGYRAAKI
ncbi:thermonuclease family protein [Angustibacter sp. McL0619]|uniref:thermonuclease family protein n=1 Tax=Angustibacter sp. McL0619 TaxID=3415676 RepID=UPI003CFAFF0B